MGSSWFKPGRGEGILLGGTQVGPEFENKSKEGDTCKLLKTGRINITNGFVPPSELWTKVEPDFSITGPCTIFHDAYHCEVPLKECSQYQQLPELTIFFNYSVSECLDVPARPMSTVYLLLGDGTACLRGLI